MPENKELPLETIWICYNKMPGGHVVAQHFETKVLTKRVGDEGEKEVTYTAEAKVEAFKKSDYVALYQNGKLEKNKVLVFPKEKDLRRYHNPAAEVIEWAMQQGVRAYVNPSEARNKEMTKQSTQEQQTEIDNLKMKVNGLEGKLTEVDSNVKAMQGSLADILAAVKGNQKSGS